MHNTLCIFHDTLKCVLDVEINIKKLSIIRVTIIYDLKFCQNRSDDISSTRTTWFGVSLSWNSRNHSSMQNLAFISQYVSQRQQFNLINENLTVRFLIFLLLFLMCLYKKTKQLWFSFTSWPSWKMESHGLRFLGALVFDLFTFCCLIWQLTLILQVYYAYKVTTKTAIFIPRDLDSFDFNICVKFSELDYDRLKKETKRDWSYDGNYKEYLQNVTVREHFEYTPKTEDVVAKISFKTFSSSRVMSVKRKDPNVKVNKYIYRAKVCYMIGPKNEDLLTYRIAALSSSSTGLIRKISFTQLL